MRYYGVRLADLRTGGLRLSELLAYIEHLPADSAVYGIEHGIPAGWTFTDFLLTDLFAVTSGEHHPARVALHEEARASDLRARFKRQQARLANPPR